MKRYVYMRPIHFRGGIHVWHRHPRASHHPGHRPGYFRANKLPEIGSGMGRAIKNFKKATSEPEEIDVTPKSDSKGQTDKKE